MVGGEGLRLKRAVVRSGVDVSAETGTGDGGGSGGTIRSGKNRHQPEMQRAKSVGRG